jgi:hypothetical protein
MAWTYNIELVEDKDKVRLLIGDTTNDDPQFQDEELEAMLLTYGSVTATAIAAARALSAKYARQADKWVGELKILASQRARAYRELADTLAKAAVSAYGVPSAGGIRVSQKETMDADTDRVKPSFTSNMFEGESE